MRTRSASRDCPANTTFRGPLFRGCSYSFMFRPPSLLASRVVPTAASSLAGQLRRVHPSRTCIVAFARIGYAIRPTTGNWRSEDFHLARFTALSTAPLTFGVHSSEGRPPLRKHRGEPLLETKFLVHCTNFSAGNRSFGEFFDPQARASCEWYP